MAASAAWGLEHWSSMESYTFKLPRDTHDGSFYRAVLAIHMNDYPVAQLYIDQARNLMDTELTAMAGESYNRAYSVSYFTISHHIDLVIVLPLPQVLHYLYELFIIHLTNYRQWFQYKC